jgi:hypothetical protein
MPKKSSNKKKAPVTETALVPVEEAFVPEVFSNIEGLLPTADFTVDDLKTWREKKADALDALQAKAMIDLQADPELRKRVLGRQGYAALESLDRMARLERGQSTQNISIAIFDSDVEKQKQRIAELEALREKLKQQERESAFRDQKSERGLESGKC